MPCQMSRSLAVRRMFSVGVIVRGARLPRLPASGRRQTGCVGEPTALDASGHAVRPVRSRGREVSARLRARGCGRRHDMGWHAGQSSGSAHCESADFGAAFRDADVSS